MSNFDQIVERIKKLSVDEKEELHLLLEKCLIEARRDEIRTNFEESKVEYKKGKAKFTSSIKDLKKFSVIITCEFCLLVLNTQF